MPRYRFTLDSGQVIEIEAENEAAAINAAEQRALASGNESRLNEALAADSQSSGYPTQQERREAYRAEYDAMPLWEQLAVGFAKPFVETYHGARELMGGDITPAQQSSMDVAEAGVHGVPGFVGELAGDLAMFAAPGGVLRGLSKVSKVGQYATTVANALRGTKGDIALGTFMEGLKADNEYRSREGRMTGAFLGGLGGAGIQGLASRALRGNSPTNAASELADELNLTQLTPGDRSGGFLRGYEQSMSDSVLTHGSVNALRRNSLEEFTDALRNRTANDAGFSVIPQQGREGWEAARSSFADAFDNIWGRDYPVIVRDMERFKSSLETLADAASKYGDASQVRRLNALTTQLDDQLRRATEDGYMVPGRTIQSIKNSLQSEVDGLYNSGGFNADFMDSLKSARDSVEQLLPQDVQDALKPLNTAYREFQLLQGAADKDLSGVITPQNLQSSILRDTSRGGVAEGRERIVGDAERALDVFGHRDTEPTFSRAVNTAFSLPVAPLVNPTVRDVITGSTAPQQVGTRIADILRLNDRLIPVTGARVGASVGNQENLAQ